MKSTHLLYSPESSRRSHQRDGRSGTFRPATARPRRLPKHADNNARPQTSHGISVRRRTSRTPPLITKPRNGNSLPESGGGGLGWVDARPSRMEMTKSRQKIKRSMRDALALDLPSSSRGPGQRLRSNNVSPPWKLSAYDDSLAKSSVRRENLEYEIIASSMSRVLDKVGRQALASESPALREQYASLELITASFSQVIHELKSSRHGLAQTLGRLSDTYRKLFKKILATVIDIRDDYKRRERHIQQECEERILRYSEETKQLQLRLRIVTEGSLAKDKVMQINQRNEKRLEKEIYDTQNLMAEHLKMTLGIDIRAAEEKTLDLDRFEQEARSLTKETWAITSKINNTLTHLNKRLEENDDLSKRMQSIFGLKQDILAVNNNAYVRPPMKNAGTETDCDLTKSYVMVSVLEAEESSYVYKAGDKPLAQIEGNPTMEKESKEDKNVDNETSKNGRRRMKADGPEIASIDSIFSTHMLPALFRGFLSENVHLGTNSDATLITVEREGIYTLAETVGCITEIYEHYLQNSRHLTLEQYMCFKYIQAYTDPIEAQGALGKLLISVLVHQKQSLFVKTVCEFLQILPVKKGWRKGKRKQQQHDSSSSMQQGNTGGTSNANICYGDGGHGSHHHLSALSDETSPEDSKEVKLTGENEGDNPRLLAHPSTDSIYLYIISLLYFVRPQSTMFPGVKGKGKSGAAESAAGGRRYFKYKKKGTDVVESTFVSQSEIENGYMQEIFNKRRCKLPEFAKAAEAVEQWVKQNAISSSKSRVFHVDLHRFLSAVSHIWDDIKARKIKSTLNGPLSVLMLTHRIHVIDWFYVLKNLDTAGIEGRSSAEQFSILQNLQKRCKPADLETAALAFEACQQLFYHTSEALRAFGLFCILEPEEAPLEIAPLPTKIVNNAPAKKKPPSVSRNSSKSTSSRKSADSKKQETIPITRKSMSLRGKLSNT